MYSDGFLLLPPQMSNILLAFPFSLRERKEGRKGGESKAFGNNIKKQSHAFWSWLVAGVSSAMQ